MVSWNRLIDFVSRDIVGITRAERIARVRSFVTVHLSIQGPQQTERPFTPTRQKIRFQCSLSLYILLLIAPPGPTRGFSVSGFHLFRCFSDADQVTVVAPT